MTSKQMKNIHGENFQLVVRRKKYAPPLNQIIVSKALFVPLFLMILSLYPQQAIYAVQFQPSLVPESKILQKEADSLPFWKNLWDEARLSARNGNYKQAVQKYNLLLKHKPEINEARWELAVVLLHLGENEQGVRNLELLVEAVPDKPDYLNRLASVLAERGHCERAVDLYSRSNDIKPDDESVLSGLATCLITLNKKKEAMPFLEKLYGQKKTDQNIRKRLALLYYDLGLYGKAENHLVVLSESSNASEEILALAARTLDHLGRENTAVGYWHRVLQRNPGNKEGREHLAAFYKDKGKVDEALAYFLSLLEMTPKNPALLNQIGRIYMESGRPGLGLPYLEHYVELEPDDKETLQYVVNLTLKLARESIGKGDLEKSKDYLARLALSDEQSPDFLLSRGALLEKLYRPDHALSDYEKFLLLRPQSYDIRLRVIGLAGEIGDLERVQKHFTLLAQDLPESEKITARLIFLKALMECGVFETAMDEYQQIIESKAPDTIKIYAYLGLADCYETAELHYEAEQYLRVALSYYDSFEILARLFEHALQISKDEDEAQYWLRRLNEFIYSSKESPGRNNKFRLRAQMMHANLLASQGFYRAAIRAGHKLLEDVGRYQGEGVLSDGKEVHDFLYTLIEDDVKIDFVKAGLALGRFYLVAGRVEAAEMQIMETNTYEVRHELNSLVLLQQIYEEMEEHVLASEAYAGAVTIAGRDVGAMIYLAGLYGAARLPEEMLKVSQKIAEQWPSSLKGKFLYAQALEMNRKPGESLLVVRDIIREHPGNMRALAKEVNLLFVLGNYEESLSACNLLLSATDFRIRPDMQILKARNLWELNQWKDSIAAYKEYLSPSVDALFVEKINQAGLPPVKPQKKKSFLDYVTFSEGKATRLISQVFTPSFVYEDEQKMKSLQRIASSYYAQYRWQEIFALEMKERLAIQRRQ